EAEDYEPYDADDDDVGTFSPVREESPDIMGQSFATVVVGNARPTHHNIKTFADFARALEENDSLSLSEDMMIDDDAGGSTLLSEPITSLVDSSVVRRVEDELNIDDSDDSDDDNNYVAEKSKSDDRRRRQSPYDDAGDVAVERIHKRFHEIIDSNLKLHGNVMDVPYDPSQPALE